MFVRGLVIFLVGKMLEKGQVLDLAMIDDGNISSHFKYPLFRFTL